MSPSNQARPAPRDPRSQERAAFALELARGIERLFPPAERLDVVAYLVTWAVGDLAQTLPWERLRQELHETLAGAVAAGLDVGLGLPGHAVIVNSLPPYTRPPA